MRVGLAMDMSVENFRGALRGVAEYARPRQQWEIYRSEATIEGLRLLLDRNVDGLIIGALYEPVLLFAKGAFPNVVSVGSPCRTPQLNTVTHDESAIGRMAAEYLCLQGFQRFACATLADKVQDDRVLAFQAAIVERGTPCPVFSGPPAEDPKIHELRFCDWLRALPKPCALFCDCDERAWFAAEVSRRLGISIPSEIAILGVDNDEGVCSLSDPALSSVDVASEQIGYTAAERLDHLFRGGSSELLTQVIPPLRVVERRSTDTALTSDPLIKKAINFMHQNLRAEGGIDALASKLASSRRVFERRFQECIGASPASMWMRFRMREAERLLLETDLSMEVVADLCGFLEARGLSANFRKHFGITPSEFRKRARPVPTHAGSNG